MSDSAVISNCFPGLTEEQKKQFSQLGDLYADWNAKINVISRKDIEHLYTRHVLHSLAIAKVISFKSRTKILDVGTGGGFPGIPLAILFPGCDFHLVDSIGKKITVVKEVSDALGLKNLRAEQIRAEELKEKYDFVVSRAVTELSAFAKWVQNKFAKQTLANGLPNGILYLKGGDLTEELKPFRNKVEVYELKDYFNDCLPPEEKEFFETKKIVYLPA